MKTKVRKRRHGEGNRVEDHEGILVGVEVSEPEQAGIAIEPGLGARCALVSGFEQRRHFDNFEEG